MVEQRIPRRVYVLFRERVHSIEQLEILLVLHEGSGRDWTAAEIAEMLNMSEKLAESALAHLEAQALVSRLPASSWRFSPASPQLAGDVDAVAATYREARVACLVLLSKLAMERVRNASLHVFASAFLLKNDRKDR